MPYTRHRPYSTLLLPRLAVVWIMRFTIMSGVSMHFSSRCAKTGKPFDATRVGMKPRLFWPPYLNLFVCTTYPAPAGEALTPVASREHRPAPQFVECSSLRRRGRRGNPARSNIGDGSASHIHQICRLARAAKEGVALCRGKQQCNSWPDDLSLRGLPNWLQQVLFNVVRHLNVNSGFGLLIGVSQVLSQRLASADWLSDHC
jgi:hypothetical protein